MQDKPVALVTGANKGIGFAIARQLGELGMRVYLGARDDDRGRAAELELPRQDSRTLYHFGADGTCDNFTVPSLYATAAIDPSTESAGRSAVCQLRVCSPTPMTMSTE